MRTYRKISSLAVSSGDLLIWKNDELNFISNFLTKAVRFLTSSEWGHVGIAWRTHDGLKDTLFVIEATIPRIQVRMIHPLEQVFCVRTGVDWSPWGRDFLLKTVGLRYSLSDAIRAYYGITLDNENDRWQCAELAYDFYVDHCGLHLPKEYQPGQLVDNMVQLTKRQIEELYFQERY